MNVRAWFAVDLVVRSGGGHGKVEDCLAWEGYMYPREQKKHEEKVFP